MWVLIGALETLRLGPLCRPFEHRRRAVDSKEAIVPETRIADVARRRLRSLRLARGWTLDELARRSYIGASTIRRIETGHRRLAIERENRFDDGES